MAKTRGRNLRARLSLFNDLLNDVELYLHDSRLLLKPVQTEIQELRNKAKDLFFKIPLK